MTIIGSASIQIRADDKFFESDVRRAVKKIKNVTIQLKADVDVSKASKKIRDLRYRITSKDAVLKVDANMAKAEAKMAAFLAKFIDKDINYNVVANTRGANTALKELADKYANKRIPFTAEGNTAVARAALAAATRPRSVAIRAHLDPSVAAALQGLFNTLTGTLPFEKIKAAITGMAANFEGLATKGSIVVSVLGAISAAALTTGANLLSIGGDITQVVGIAALMPAAFGTMASVLVVNKMAWDNFGAALTGTGKKAAAALEKLDPIARSAVLGLKGTWTAIQKPVQNAFWTKMGTSLQDTVNKLLPSLKTGLSGIGASMGGLSKQVLTAFGKLSDGTLTKMLGATAKGLANMGPGIQPFIGALNTLGLVGTTYLPKFGTYLADAAKHFAGFISTAEKTGQINLWIETGVKRLQELGSIAKSTAGFFTGLTNAARVSGAPGLTDMANGMKNLADIANSEPFKSRLVAIFEGARRGTDKLKAGLRTVTDLFSESAKSVGIFLDAAGRVAGLTFENITAMFNGTGLGSGLLDAVTGLGDAMDAMKPGFKDLGTLIGNLGTIAGEVLRSMAPGLNQLFGTLNGVVAGLQDGVMKAMPIFNEFVQSILALASGPVVAIAEAFGNLLTFFAGLPAPIQNVLMALGGFLLLKPKLTGLFDGIRKSAANAFNGMAFDTDAAGQRTSTAFGRNMDKIRGAWRTVGTAFNNPSVSTGPVRALDRVSAAAGQSMRALGTTANQGLRGAANGAMSLLGGPWGAALAVAGAGIAMFADYQARAKQDVDNLAAALDQQTGAMTAAGQKVLTTKLLDLDATPLDDFFRSGRRNMEELVKSTDMNMEQVVAALSNPEGRDQYVKNFQKLVDAQGDGRDVTDDLARSVNMTKEQFKDLSQTDLHTMNDQIKKAAEQAKDAEAKVKGVADAMGTNTVVAAQLAKNYDVLKSSTSSASAKFSALKENVDLLTGSHQTARKASRDYQQTLATTKDEVKRIVTENKGVIDSNGRISDSFRKTLVDSKGIFSDATQGSRDFATSMDGAADAILKQGTAALQKALEANKSMPDAANDAMLAMAKPIADFRERLKGMGFDAGQINGMLKELGLDPEKLQGALKLDTSDAEAKIARASLMAAAFANGNYAVALSATSDQVKEALLKTEEYRDAYNNGGWEAVVDVINKGGPKIQDFLLALTEAKTEADVKKILDAEFTGKPTFEAAAAAMDGYNMKPAQRKEFHGVDNVTAPAAAAKKSVEDLNATGVLGKYVTLTDNASVPASLARDSVVRWNDTGILDKLINATDNTAPAVESAKINMSGVPPIFRAITAQDNTSPAVAQAKGSMGSVVSIFPSISAINKTMAGVNSSKTNINGVLGKAVDITANDKASTTISNIDKQQIAPKSFSVVGILSGLPQTLRNALGLAVGGVIAGNGVQKFAKGGFSGVGVKAFANGGTENHVAQIAKGAWPVRMWAEPETGGEAYIPLGKGKRTRSLKILEEVASMFGMSLLKTRAFASGGTMGATSSASGSSSSASTSSGNVSAALLTSITQSLMKDSGGLNSIGENIVSGIIGGVNNKRGAAVLSMKVLSNDLEDTVKTELDIHSPSKAFLSLGKYIVDGLAIGIKTTGSTAIKNMATLSNRLYVAARDVAKATGRSVDSSIDLLNRQKSLNSAWRKIGATKYTDQIVDYYQKTGKTGNRTLADIAVARDNITTRLNVANKRLKDQTAARAEVIKDISSKMSGEFKLGSNILSDNNTFVPEMRFSDVKSYATGVLGRLRTFNSKLQALRKKGIAPALINEVAQLGSAEGIAMADALLGGSAADVKGLNADVAAIASVSNSIGVSTADGMYKAGLDATRGLVNGLTKDKNSLTQAATRISNTLVNTVKSNLGIRSPSRVFAEMGRYTTQGYIVGLDQMQPTLNKRVDSLINVVPRRNTSLSAVGSPVAPAGVDAVTGATTAPIIVQVNPSANMDEEAVGRAAVRELNWQLISR